MTENLKDVIVALINNGYFAKYADDKAENTAKDIAKFVKTYFNETRD